MCIPACKRLRKTWVKSPRKSSLNLAHHRRAHIPGQRPSPVGHPCAEQTEPVSPSLIDRNGELLQPATTELALATPEFYSINLAKSWNGLRSKLVDRSIIPCPAMNSGAIEFSGKATDHTCIGKRPIRRATKDVRQTLHPCARVLG